MKLEALTFRALIDGVHYDPKKGLVKIQLIANHVSLDKLTSLGPQDESIQVTLESLQTIIGDSTPKFKVEEAGFFSTDAGDPIKSPRGVESDEDAEVEHKEEEDKTKSLLQSKPNGVEQTDSDDEQEEGIVTEFPLEEANDKEDEEEDKEG